MEEDLKLNKASVSVRIRVQVSGPWEAASHSSQAGCKSVRTGWMDHSKANTAGRARLSEGCSGPSAANGWWSLWWVLRQNHSRVQPRSTLSVWRVILVMHKGTHAKYKVTQQSRCVCRNPSTPGQEGFFLLSLVVVVTASYPISGSSASQSEGNWLIYTNGKVQEIWALTRLNISGRKKEKKMS